MTDNKPIDTLRDGAIKASIWKNTASDGTPFYSVTFDRTFTDSDGMTKSSSSFSASGILKLSRLAEKAYDQIAVIRAQDSARQAA